MPGTATRRQIEASPPKAKRASRKADSSKAVTEDDLLKLIDGKTIGEFTVASINLVLPADLRNRLLDANDLVPGWLAQGLITSDGDKYSLVD